MGRNANSVVRDRNSQITAVDATSRDGRSSINIEFTLDRDLEDFNAGLFLHRQLLRLREANIPLLFITGNHDATNLPVVVVGRGGGRIKTGQCLDYSDKPNRQMCRLYLSLMAKMGLRPKTFGDATMALEEV